MNTRGGAEVNAPSVMQNLLQNLEAKVATLSAELAALNFDSEAAMRAFQLSFTSHFNEVTEKLESNIADVRVEVERPEEVDYARVSQRANDRWNR